MTLSCRYAAVLLAMVALAASGCQSPTIVVLEDPRTYVEERGIFVAREDARIRLDIQALYVEHFKSFCDRLVLADEYRLEASKPTALPHEVIRLKRVLTTEPV